jgi:hypothetical protein
MIWLRALILAKHGGFHASPRRHRFLMNQPLARAASVKEIWRAERSFRITIFALCIVLAGAVVSYFTDPPQSQGAPAPHDNAIR